MKPKYIVIHSMAENIRYDGELLHAKEFLRRIGLSAHLFLGEDGLICGKYYDQVAYHAGVSKYKEDTNLNKCSVGIELLISGVDNYTDWIEAIKKPESFTDSHYKLCAFYCAQICNEFNLVPRDAIVLHSWISGDDVRGDGKGKKDPGQGFDYERLVSMTKASLIEYFK